MQLEKEHIKDIVKKLLKAENHRQVIVDLIDREFLKFTMKFFKEVAEAKIENNDITSDWYKRTFLHDGLRADEIAIHAGLNKKTIDDMYYTSRKEVVLDASHEHYDSLCKIINDLADEEDSIDFKLTIKYNAVSVELSISESLIVINAIAVKRAQIRGGAWSAQGKGVEGPLMETLCRLYGVPEKYFSKKSKGTDETVEDFEREVDFYLYSKEMQEYKCEVKLMGKGNPESADAIVARGSKIFVADKLSEKGIKQIDSRNVEWVQLANKGGFKKFEKVLKNLHVPHKSFNGNIDSRVDEILDKIL